MDVVWTVDGGRSRIQASDITSIFRFFHETPGNHEMSFRYENPQTVTLRRLLEADEVIKVGLMVCT